MIGFENLSRSNLIKIIQAYNLTHKIRLTNDDNSKRTKNELITDIKKHLYIDEKDKKIKEIQQQDFIEALPPTILQQKNIKATLTELKKTPELKKLMKKEDLEYLEKNKPKKSKKAIEKEKIQAENMKKLFEANIKESSDSGFNELIKREKEARKRKAEREKKGIYKEERKKTTPKTKISEDDKVNKAFEKKQAKEAEISKKADILSNKLLEEMTVDNFEEVMAKLLGKKKPEIKKMAIEGEIPNNTEIKNMIQKLNDREKKLKKLLKKMKV